MERFWSKVKKLEDGCWEWLSYKNKDGYGEFWLNGRKRAHRVVWEMVNGVIPKNLCVLHSCDNPSCVNPEHLFLGTQIDNIRDRDKKNRCRARGLPGEKNGMSRLTEDEVREIKMFLLNGLSQRIIAQRYGVCQKTISCIYQGITWTHLDSTQ